MKKVKLFFEYCSIAFSSIKDNKLRSGLTMSIIAVGIMALIGIITASDAIKKSLNDSFMGMGVSILYVIPKYEGSSDIIKSRKRELRITKDQAYAFKTAYEQKTGAKVAVSFEVGNVKVSYLSNESNPNVYLTGIDNNKLSISNKIINSGRDFSAQELQSGANVAILSAGLEKKIFNGVDPIGKYVSSGGARYLVVGTLHPAGSSIGRNTDMELFIPLTSPKVLSSVATPSYIIEVLPKNETSAVATENITRIFRSIRLLRPIDKDNFEIMSNETMAEEFNKILNGVSYGIYVFGFIAIFGASIGLMNIMLVSVSEKTREIGTRKAIGASSSAIKQQFLMESIIISLMGGAIGIVIGIIIGNAVAMFMEAPFIIPWFWIITGLVLCFIVGVLSGYIPAIKASRFDPIEALRYE